MAPQSDAPAFDGWMTFGYTRDLARTTAFYGGTLGLPLALDRGGCRVWRVREGAYVGFCERDIPGREGVILTLLTEDVDGWQARLESQGIAIEKRAQPNPTYGIYHLFCRDPNGYLVELQRFDDPRWDRAAPAR